MTVGTSDVLEAERFIVPRIFSVYSKSNYQYPGKWFEVPRPFHKQSKSLSLVHFDFSVFDFKVTMTRNNPDKIIYVLDLMPFPGKLSYSLRIL